MKGKYLTTATNNPRRPGIAVKWGYLGLACRLSGCGGRI
jgi:hypothetical protein